MVTADLLRSAIDQLEKWSPRVVSTLTWVNWRRGYQVKISWHGNATFACYLDFGKNCQARDAVLKCAFEAFAVAGDKPRVIDGHGWKAMDYSLQSNSFISSNDVAAMAKEMGLECSILYVQECVASRPIFITLGIPLVPGEMGKEWVNGEFVPYARPIGQNL